MDPTGATPFAPPVVAVVVVHDPGDWFEAQLRSLAGQEYPNLSLLFLVAGDRGDIPDRIHRVLPGAHIRTVAENPGFGATANQALRLVEGSGLFCFLHDDVALQPDTIRCLVEELYRSNAGIVGPKIVDWDNPRVLQHVGFAVDRFGETDAVVEPGELDQEQHDAVRDVFCLPSACLLVRADLFRELRGFCEDVDFHGDDLDLCWRAHLSGARVLVVPAAVVRHRERLAERRPDFRHRAVAARHRVGTVAALSGRWRAPVVLIEALVLGIVQMIVGVFTGGFWRGVTSVGALVGLVPRTGEILRRRRDVRRLRRVPDREVARLQLRGSARLSSFLRHRQLAAEQQRAAKQSIAVPTGPRGPALLGITLAVLFVVGSRGLVRAGIPAVGEFVELPRAGDALRAYVSGWDGAGFGATEATPTSLAFAGILSLVSFGRSGLLLLLAVLLPIVIGYVGAWRMSGIFPSMRARIGVTAVYAALPLPYAAVSIGRWQVLAVYAATPWALDIVRRASGLATFVGREWGEDDIADAVTDLRPAERLRLLGELTVVTAVTTAFAPAFLLVLVVLAAAVLLGTLVARGATSVISGTATAALAVVGALLLNLPWSARLLREGGWQLIAGTPLDTPRDLGVVRLAQFGIGRSVVGVLAVALFVPVLAAPLVARGWRLTWAARAGAMAIGVGILVVLDDRGSFPVQLPEAGILLCVVGVGVALAAGCALAAFEHDIRGARFGWRQPLGLVVGVGLLIGILPGIAGAANGRWSARTITFRDLLLQLPPSIDPRSGEPIGDYRVVFVGDPRGLPAPGHSLDDGTAYAVLDDGGLGYEDLWSSPRTTADPLLVEALDAVASASTTRAGRLFGPLGVRYIVVPVDDGTQPDGVEPPPVPEGLLSSLSRQLDLRLVDSPNRLVIYENMAWLPVRSLLDPTAASASTEASAAVRVSRDLGTGQPVFVAVPPFRPASAAVPAGTLHLAEPIDAGWRLTVDGATVAPRTAFGWSAAWELPNAGQARLVREPDGIRRVLLGLQLALWVGVLVLVRSTWFDRRSVLSIRTVDGERDDAPMLDLDLLATRDLDPVGVDADDPGAVLPGAPGPDPSGPT